ncbi:hypothetical protein SDA22_00155 [Legionella pneumophila serogroup 1]|uniref:hypothetical protein n=2 Tax=Legionella pneumophila TaxID=446 RepID=UPI0007709655|nr:hypothetical protein [Legionella pneumophila]MCZ4738853.1 hypothetical protein [Legionella pneumophila]MCZ4747081.1 hypothetical protein [Legionella pneumophila]MDI9827277.1 hypothetical protein [Legionella pneumophila]MDI9844268.1 hypothetical protein [Legionella pneumophila]MDO5157282.1 hypothetical protein [Legionella pneumophila]
MMLGYGRLKKIIALILSVGPIFILASCTISSSADNVLQADEQSASYEHQKHKGHGGYGGGRGGGGVGGR